MNGETREERDQQAAEFLAAIEPLKDSVPSVRALSVKRNELNVETNFDLTLIADFDDEAGLREYAEHPEHQPVLAMGKRLVKDRACTDFTI